MDTELVQCRNCRLTIENMHVNEDGECIFCLYYKNKWQNRDYVKKELEFLEIVRHFKEKYKDKPYDCIVPVSGGKDSVYVLYLAVKRYGLRPLAVTYNNGLQTELARENIRNAVQILGVDQIAIAPDKSELQMLYKDLFHKTKNMCTACNHAINTTIVRTAAEKEIEFILLGGVGKLEQAPIYGGQRYCMEDIFLRITKDSIPLGISKRYCNKDIRRNFPVYPVSIFNYVNYDYRTVLNTLKEELNWKESDHGDTKIDCVFYRIISYYKYKQNGITSTRLMASALLRDGQISEEEFERRINKEKVWLENTDKDKIREFHEFLDIDEKYLEKNVHILNYNSPIFNEKDLKDLSFNIYNLPNKQVNESTNQQINDSKIQEFNDLEKIKLIISKVRPEIQRDGGDLRIVSFEDNVLKIEMLGDCRGCLQVDDTMVPYIESLIYNFVSEEIEVENVFTF